MTIVDKVKDAVGLGHGHDAPTGRMDSPTPPNALHQANDNLRSCHFRANVCRKTPNGLPR